MSNVFRKVRIVHSPEEQCYYVQQKKLWDLWWDHVDTIRYVDVRSTSPFGCHDLMADAFEKARKKAEMLLARSVVWEKANYGKEVK